MKNVKIKLINESNKSLYLVLNYFPKAHGEKTRTIDNYYLTENLRFASPIPLKDARKWMREAKTLAAFDGDVIVKSEYLLNGKPTTLAAAGRLS